MLSSAVGAAVDSAARLRPPRDQAGSTERRRPRNVRAGARGRSREHDRGFGEEQISNGGMIFDRQVRHKNMVVNDGVATQSYPAKPTARLPQRTYLWVSAWFLITAPVVLWDAAFCFMR
jgi:hypothetical protein